ncbi:MAG: dTMP kinase [Acidobacteriota bacterium]
MKKGLLIVFEGIDGSGKTTISKLFFDHLIKMKLKVSWFREPSDSKWGQKIRELADTKSSIPINEELNYFIMDRKWDVEKNIIPALNRGEIVILDRYYFSTACYQGARGLDIKKIISMNTEFAPEHDLLFLIDVDVDTAMTRIKKGRIAEAKLFEKKDFLKKVRQNYLNLDIKNIKIIDGRNEINTVLSDVISEFDQLSLQ